MGRFGKENRRIVLFIILGISLRIILSLFTEGYFADIYSFRSWGYVISHYGFYNAYKGTDLPFYVIIDYLPLPLYIFAFIGKLFYYMTPSQFITGHLTLFIFKIISLPFETLLLFFIYKRYGKDALLVSILMTTVILDEYFIGSINMIDVSLGMIGLFLLTENPFLSAIIISFSILSKPYVLLFLPFIFIELFKRKGLLKFVLGFLFGFGIIELPHLLNHTFIESLYAALENTSLMHGLSNGMNSINYIAGDVSPIIPMILYLAIYIYIFFLYIKEKIDLWEGVVLSLFSFFFVFPFIHANHTATRLLYFMPLLSRKRYRTIFFLIFVHSLINMTILMEPVIVLSNWIYILNAVFSVIILILFFFNIPISLNFNYNRLIMILLILSLFTLFLPFIDYPNKTEKEISDIMDKNIKGVHIAPLSGIKKSFEIIE